MSTPDYAKAVKDALADSWLDLHPTWTPVLEIPRNYQPVAGSVALLVADDGGPAVVRGAWLVGHTPRNPVLRLTAAGAGRTEARESVVAAADFVVTNRPGIARVENVSDPLITRDRDTGAVLASITMPVIVRQTP